MTMCNVKGVGHSDRNERVKDIITNSAVPLNPTELFSHFSSLLWFYSAQLHCSASLFLYISFPADFSKK